MVWEINKNTTNEELSKMFEAAHKEQQKLQPKKVFNAKKFNGILKHVFTEDPLEIQRNLRDEWERDFN